jgi:hypothetical protein
MTRDNIANFNIKRVYSMESIDFMQKILAGTAMVSLLSTFNERRKL